MLLQIAVVAVGFGYLVSLGIVFSSENKSIAEKLGVAAVATVIAIVIVFALLAAVFSQGELG